MKSVSLTPPVMELLRIIHPNGKWFALRFEGDKIVRRGELDLDQAASLFFEQLRHIVESYMKLDVK